MSSQPPFQPDPSSESQAGSSPSGEPVFLAVGKLRRPHGIQGEMLMDILTDFPERLRSGKQVYVGDAHRPMIIHRTRRQDRAMLVTFSGLENIDQVAWLRNQIVYVRTDELPRLPEGEYYHHQLLGLCVLDESGQDLGFLSEILETGANDVYVVVNPNGNEKLLPAIPEVILGVDLEQRAMRVRVQDFLE